MRANQKSLLIKTLSIENHDAVEQISSDKIGVELGWKKV